MCKSRNVSFKSRFFLSQTLTEPKSRLTTCQEARKEEEEPTTTSLYRTVNKSKFLNTWCAIS